MQLEAGQPARALGAAPTGKLVTNPPYGVRIGDKDELAKFYPSWATSSSRSSPAGPRTSSPAIPSSRS